MRRIRVFFSFFDTGFCYTGWSLLIAQAGLKFSIPYLSLLSAGISGRHHPARQDQIFSSSKR
jgi:hypothetical protein